MLDYYYCCFLTQIIYYLWFALCYLLLFPYQCIDFLFRSVFLKKRADALTIYMLDYSDTG